MSIDIGTGYEDGTLAATLATGGAGDPTPFDLIGINGAGAALIYDNAHVLVGSKAAKHSLGASGDQSAIYWTTAYGSRTDPRGRIYLYLTAAPPTNEASVMNISDAGNLCCQIRIRTDRTIALVDSTHSDQVASTAALPLNQWVRIEFYAHMNKSTGSLEAKLFFGADPHSTSPTETVSMTGKNTRSTSDAIYFGPAEVNANFTYWSDAVGVNFTAYPGPAVTSQLLAPVADVSHGTWTHSTGATDYGVIDEPTADDADYIASSSSPSSADVCKVRLAGATDPAVSTGHTLHIRYKKDASGGDRIDLTVTLRAADGTTQIAQKVYSDIGAVVTDDWTITGTEADSIPSADYATGLVLEFSAVKV